MICSWSGYTIQPMVEILLPEGQISFFWYHFFLRSHDLVCVLEVSHKVFLYMLIITLGQTVKKWKLMSAVYRLLDLGQDQFYRFKLNSVCSLSTTNFNHNPVLNICLYLLKCSFFPEFLLLLYGHCPLNDAINCLLKKIIWHLESLGQYCQKHTWPWHIRQCRHRHIELCWS